ncbi:hypothetical protein ACFL49_03660, partial [Candidatus Omnitrophota bacterium]
MVLSNLQPVDGISNCVLKDPTVKEYGAAIRNDSGEVIDSLRGIIKKGEDGFTQIYLKGIKQPVDKNIDFLVLFRHFIALIFMSYFFYICWGVGCLIAQKCKFEFDSVLEGVVLPVLLGAGGVTYLVFLLGSCQLLYFNVIFPLLLLLLIFTLYKIKSEFQWKNLFLNQLQNIKRAPWKIGFIGLLLGTILYNLSYCFKPATYIDGSGDLNTLTLPNLSDYIRAHNFDALINNATNGILSQVFDVLRAVAMMFSGEVGVYLYSFMFLLLMVACLYLISKKIFNITHPLIYLSLAFYLTSNTFTDHLHLGKYYVIGLGYLFAFMYTSKFYAHKKNYLLPVILLAFLTSQYIFFAFLGLGYFVVTFLAVVFKEKRIKGADVMRYLKAGGLFAVLSSLFHVKLLFEVGIFMPPGMITAKLSNIFKEMNAHNPLYKYIDNDYIRFHCKYKGLVMQTTDVTIQYLARRMSELFVRIDFSYFLLLLPFIKKINLQKVVFSILVVILPFIFVVTYPNLPPRMAVFYIYLIYVLMWASIDGFFVFVNSKFKKSFLQKSINVAVCMALVCFVVLQVSPKGVKLRKAKFVWSMTHPLHIFGLHTVTWPLMFGKLQKYDFLKMINTDREMFKGTKFFDHHNFDYGLLIRQHMPEEGTLLVVPIRFHQHANRRLTARHALGSVIYQDDLSQIMRDLKKLNITHLSVTPILYRDYNPVYTKIFEDALFYKYFQFLFSYRGRKLYRIVYDGSNTEYTQSPYNVKGLPF